MPLQLSYIASNSRNMEALLQTYRQINLTIQSLFLVMGTFLLSRILGNENLFSKILLEFLLICLTIFSNVVMIKFQKVIIARGDDVNWWHREMVLAEQNMPPSERIFTHFKIHQNHGKLEPQYLEKFLSDPGNATKEEIIPLLGADLDQIRKIINSYILKGMRLMWYFLLFLSIGGFI